MQRDRRADRHRDRRVHNAVVNASSDVTALYVADSVQIDQALPAQNDRRYLAKRCHRISGGGINKKILRYRVVIPVAVVRQHALRELRITPNRAELYKLQL